MGKDSQSAESLLTYLTPEEQVELNALIGEDIPSDYTAYQRDALGYAEDVLGVSWWDKQQEVARKLVTPPYRVLVKACHDVGKTHLAGGLVNWWFDAYPNSVTLTTAPTDRQVKDLLWKEIRVQRHGRGGFAGPKIPRLELAPDWFAHGYVAKEADAFQGHHAEHMLFVFDEATGVDHQFWEATESMFAGEGHGWVCIFNPTDTSSQAYQEEMSGKWHVVEMSMLTHPNIIAESNGLRPPYPSAIRLSRVTSLVDKWCTPIEASEKRTTDFVWPPKSNEWWRPGPIAESRMLGRWPSQATNNVWSDASWQAASKIALEPGGNPVEIGCDVGRFGDDNTEVHVRQGPVSLHHESHNGWDTKQIAGRLKELCGTWAKKTGMDARKIAVKVDDTGVGGGVTDQKDDYNFIPINSKHKAIETEKYPNRRSELWFTVAERANKGNLSFARLPEEVKIELRRQAMTPTWKQLSDGSREVEDKALTKRRIKRSPDGMDAVNLAYAPFKILYPGDMNIVSITRESAWRAW